ncbi:iron permease [bacterium]|nr:iron permease [bacterium]
MSPTTLLIAYCFAIACVSLAGGWLPSRLRLTHLQMQMVMSLVAGMMLGVAILHLLPHAAEHLGNTRWLSGSLLTGVLLMLFLLRFSHVHHHGGGNEPHECDIGPSHSHGHDHDHAQDHDHDNDVGESATAVASSTLHTAADSAPTRHRMSGVGLFAGLAVHTLFDGIALGASVAADAGHSPGTLALFGLGTFFAVVLHKPVDAMSITSVMRAGGWPHRSQMLMNLAFATVCPLGVLLFWLGSTRSESESLIVGCALAFSAGAFLCISLTDLIPEALSHSHDKLKLSLALLFGSALAIGIELLPGHSHATHSNHDLTTEHEDDTSQNGGHQHHDHIGHQH